MQKVTGIGGFFFKAKDPENLDKWYYQHLGIDLVPKSYDVESWQQQAGPTEFAPFSQDTKFW